MMVVPVPQISIVVCGDVDVAASGPELALLPKLRVPFLMTVLDRVEPDRVREYCRDIARNGVEVVVAMGDDVHGLAGWIAAYTTLPVVAVPMSVSGAGRDLAAGQKTAPVGDTATASPRSRGGGTAEWAALLATLETPAGVPVAVVGINAIYNGIYLALQILGVKDRRVRARLAEDRSKRAANARERARNVAAFARRMQEEGLPVRPGGYRSPRLYADLPEPAGRLTPAMFGDEAMHTGIDKP